MLDESTRKLAHRRPDSRETAQQEGGGKSRIRLHFGRAMVRRGVAAELAGPMAFESHEFIRMTPIRALTREQPAAAAANSQRIRYATDRDLPANCCWTILRTRRCKGEILIMLKAGGDRHEHGNNRKSKRAVRTRPQPRATRPRRTRRRKTTRSRSSRSKSKSCENK